MILPGVSGTFRATHTDPFGVLEFEHDHHWHVTAWFDPPTRVDARCLRASLHEILRLWDGKKLPASLSLGEDIARAVGVLANCVEVEVRRDDEQIHARWGFSPDTGNLYKHRFNVRCPNNSASIAYALEIRTSRTIMVEDIVEHCASIAAGYHEEIADNLHKRFGGFQIILAHHHGVDIETRRR